jgi:hypothetical protein
LLVGVIFAFIAELPFLYFPNPLDAVGFLGGFVVSYAGDSAEPQCHLALVAGALLDFVVSNFHHDFRDNIDAVTVLTYCRFL